MTQEEKDSKVLLLDSKLKEKISANFDFGLFNCYYELILGDFDVDKTLDKIITDLANRPRQTFKSSN
jgi:hypothetical protein